MHPNQVTLETLKVKKIISFTRSKKKRTECLYIKLPESEDWRKITEGTAENTGANRITFADAGVEPEQVLTGNQAIAIVREHLSKGWAYRDMDDSMMIYYEKGDSILDAINDVMVKIETSKEEAIRIENEARHADGKAKHKKKKVADFKEESYKQNENCKLGETLRGIHNSGYSCDGNKEHFWNMVKVTDRHGRSFVFEKGGFELTKESQKVSSGHARNLAVEFIVTNHNMWTAYNEWRTLSALAGDCNAFNAIICREVGKPTPKMLGKIGMLVHTEHDSWKKFKIKTREMSPHGSCEELLELLALFGECKK